MRPYDSEYDYDKNGWATGIPWWWRSAPYHQWIMNLGEGIPNFFTMGMFIWAAPGAIIAGFTESPWWFIAAFALWLPVLLLVPAQLYAGWRTAHQRDTMNRRAQRLRVAEYRQLPHKYHKELRPLAKLVDNPECTSKLEEEWQKLIDDLWELHGKVHYTKTFIESKQVRKGIAVLDKVKADVADQKEQARIARELEEEIRANLEKQNINLEGIDKLYG